jgi:hypothetical protein
LTRHRDGLVTVTCFPYYFCVQRDRLDHGPHHGSEAGVIVDKKNTETPGCIVHRPRAPHQTRSSILPLLNDLRN